MSSSSACSIGFSRIGAGALPSRSPRALQYWPLARRTPAGSAARNGTLPASGSPAAQAGGSIRIARNSASVIVPFGGSHRRSRHANEIPPAAPRSSNRMIAAASRSRAIPEAHVLDDIPYQARVSRHCFFELSK